MHPNYVSTTQMTKELIHSCTNLANQKTAVQFPPRALSGSSNMLFESSAVLVPCDGRVFFDLWGAFDTGFTVLGEKMSSLKKQRCGHIVIKLNNQVKNTDRLYPKCTVQTCLSSFIVFVLTHVIIKY